MLMNIDHGAGIKLIISITFLVIAAICHPVSAEQTSQHSHHDEHESHHDHANEIGISSGAVYLTEEQETALGLHLHYTRRLQGSGLARYFGLGAGLETIFSDHVHNNIMGTISMYPYRSLVLSLSPGILMVEHDDELEQTFSTHFEASYGFMISGFEVGPVVGYGLTSEEEHYTLGLHFGKGF